MKAIRLLGGLAFAAGLFVVVFAGMPWYVHQDPFAPWWLKTAVYCLMGGVLVVLLTAAAESRGVKKTLEKQLIPDECPGQMFVQTSTDVPNHEVAEVCGLVRGHTVFAISLARDIAALMRMVLGGELVEYTEMMGQAREIATGRMIAEAHEMGADAVTNVRYVTASVVGTAAELLAYGTAVKIRKISQA